MVEGELYMMGHIEIGGFSYVGKGTLIQSGVSIAIGKLFLISHGGNVLKSVHIER
jgi:hypothetical protein